MTIATPDQQEQDTIVSRDLLQLLYIGHGSTIYRSDDVAGPQTTLCSRAPSLDRGDLDAVSRRRGSRRERRAL